MIGSEQQNVVPFYHGDFDRRGRFGIPRPGSVLVPENRLGPDAGVFDETEFEKARTVVVDSIDGDAALMVDQAGRLDCEGENGNEAEKKEETRPGKKRRGKRKSKGVHGATRVETVHWCVNCSQALARRGGSGVP